MPKKKHHLTPEEQRKRFEDEVRRLERAGELDRDAAERALENMVKNQGRRDKIG